MKRIPMKSGDEFDAFTGWKRYLFWKPGQRKRIKKRYNKRFRQESKKMTQRHLNSFIKNSQSLNSGDG